MTTEKVHIQPSANTPDVFLDPAGIIKITGRAVDESRTKFSDQLMRWIDSYVLDPAESTDVVIALEYLNSFNSIYLASVLRKVNQVIQMKKKLSIKWYIEEDDDDLLERAEYISATFSIPIQFIMTDHIKNWY